MRGRTAIPTLLALVVLSCSRVDAPAAAEAPPLRWNEWSPEVFERARAEGKLVLLDLGAVWCHWCHVMEETTYADAEVRNLMDRGYVAVQVDQARRPDLAARYGDWGWPATIIFDASAHEIGKFRGYIEPQRMRSLLAAYTADPTAGPSAVGGPSLEGALRRGSTELEPDLRKELVELHERSRDDEQGSWGFSHKYLPTAAIEWTLALAEDGDARAASVARRALDGNLALLDPVWGGFYQYSHGGVWTNPHFEKIMATEADAIRVHARAGLLFREPRYLEAAARTAGYLLDFLLSPEGAFHPSQDADLEKGEHAGSYFALDDAGRRALGLPAVDAHLFARENGQAIRALAELHAATGDDRWLLAARKACAWVERERAVPGGGFRHDIALDEGLYLGDGLAMGQAYLALHLATGERIWLDRALDAARFIAAHFIDQASAGVLTSSLRPEQQGPFRPVALAEENVDVARFARRLEAQTGDPVAHRILEQAMGFLTIPEIARQMPTAGTLLADHDALSKPMEVIIVGMPTDAATIALHRAARSIPREFKRVTVWHPSQGPLAASDVQYPAGASAQAFICADGACSPPVSTPEELIRVASR